MQSIGCQRLLTINPPNSVKQRRSPGSERADWKVVKGPLEHRRMIVADERLQAEERGVVLEENVTGRHVSAIEQVRRRVISTQDRMRRRSGQEGVVLKDKIQDALI